MQNTGENNAAALKDRAVSRFCEMYGRAPERVAEAPGRIELIGNHTDYNGGFVMGIAIDRKIACAVARRPDRKACFANAKTGAKAVIDIGDIRPFPRDRNWANYPLGVFKFLVEAGMDAPCGFDYADASGLPSGSGLSSSAAVETAACVALSALYGFSLEKKAVAAIGRKCENEFVGMPCGILDQGVSVFGRKDSAVFIDCLTEDYSTCPLPGGCSIYLFNSTKKHALVDGLYAERHAECMEAARAMSEVGREQLLRAFTAEDLEAARPMMGKNAYKRALHVINENARVLAAREMLARGDAKGAGSLLFQSHESSKTLFENSCEEIDFLVNALSEAPGVYGARITGGGFGGAAMALTGGSFSQTDAAAVAEKYAKRFGKAPLVMKCSASGGASLV